MKMKVPLPFDLASTLESGQAHRWRREDPWYCGVVRGNLINVRQQGSYIEAFSAPKPPEELKELLHDYFRLDDDLEVIYGVIDRDPRINKMIQNYPGLRLLRQEPWECLVAFICSATSNIARIASNMEAMADAFGHPVTLDDHNRHTFPSASRLAQAGEGALRDLGLGFRAPYVINAAIQVAKGALDLEELIPMPYWEARARLVELRGVGPKIADCVLAFSLEKLEAFPIDRWVSRAMLEWYLDGQKMKYDDIVRWAHDYFGSYAGYAQQYLFHGRRLAKGAEVSEGSES